MSKRCIVCHIQQDKNQNRTFHAFPKDLERQQTWIMSLALSKDLPKYPYICSDHFVESDFTTKPSGMKYLTKDAIPSRLCESPSLLNFRRQSVMSDYKAAIESAQRSSPLLSEHSSSTLTASSPKYTVENVETSPERTVTASSPSNSIEIVSSVGLFSVQPRISPEHTSTASSPSSSFMVPPPRKKKKLQNPRYIGDCESDDMNDPVKAKRNWNLAKKKIEDQRKKINSLLVAKRRLKNKIYNLQTLMNYFKTNNMISDAGESMINASLSKEARNILTHFLKGPSHRKYTPELRSFALTLHFYSNKAYNYVRQKFNKTLPHPRTISKWYQAVDASPGFTTEALNALKQKSLISSERGKKVICNLLMDEMSIRSLVEWTGEEIKGYVDMGTGVESDDVALAKEALVFMLVCLNDHWKIPVAYFLLNGLNASEKTNLVNKLLTFLHESDIIVSSFTFDGLGSNLSMCTELGADITDYDNLKTSFLHPITNEDVFIFLDPSHNIKLVRNCLASYKCLVDSEGNKILWEYIEKLNDFQYDEGLTAGTKLKKRHINWKREKMRVKLAAQTLSNSVGDALIYLSQDLKHTDFQGAVATGTFCKYFNNLFDIFNVRNRLSKAKFGKPLSPATAQTIFDYLDECSKYIKGLKFNNVPILQSKRKTGFLGFLICIDSLKKYYQKYVKIETPLLKFILTYKFSQDHLEIFFSAVRSKGGHNNNPSARQFEAIYKRLLLHSEVKGADTGNCIALDTTSILYVGSGSLTRNFNGDMMESTEYINISNEINDHDYLSSSIWHLTTYVTDVVSYIAGYVVRSLKKCITCKHCCDVLESDISFSKLQARKKYGALTNASQYVVKVCSHAELLIKTLEMDGLNKKMHQMDYLVNCTLHNLPPNIYDNFNNHILEQEIIDNHHVNLTKLILKKYFNIRMRHETSKMSNLGNRVRSVLTKSILFQNQ